MLEEIVARIAAVLKRPGFNKVMLAEVAGVHRNTLEGYDSPDWNPSAVSLDKLMKAVTVLEGLPPK